MATATPARTTPVATEQAAQDEPPAAFGGRLNGGLRITGNPRRVWIRFYDSRTILPLTAAVRVTPAVLPVVEYEPEDDPRPVADNPPRPPLDNRKPPPAQDYGRATGAALRMGCASDARAAEATSRYLPSMPSRPTSAPPRGRGDNEAAQSLHNLAAQLPDPQCSS